VPGTPLDCDDADACTRDSCDPTGGCANVAIDCDDADPCTMDSCDVGTGCINDPVTCPEGETCVDGVCEVCNSNGVCEVGEDCNNCAADCISGTSDGAVCGNGVCEAGNGEDCVICPEDCNGKQNGRPSGRFCCGDGDGVNPLPCDDGACSTGGWSCTDVPVSDEPYCCGDLDCAGDEDFTNCEIDCPAPFCGDSRCDPGEDQCGCPSDCGDPPDNETDCSDGVDNDCDGLTDGDDPDCACGSRGAGCSTGDDCCSGSCKRNGTCR